MPANLKNSAVATGLEKVIFISMYDKIHYKLKNNNNKKKVHSIVKKKKDAQATAQLHSSHMLVK